MERSYSNQSRSYASMYVSNIILRHQLYSTLCGGHTEALHDCSFRQVPHTNLRAPCAPVPRAEASCLLGVQWLLLLLLPRQLLFGQDMWSSGECTHGRASLHAFHSLCFVTSGFWLAGDTYANALHRSLLSLQHLVESSLAGSISRSNAGLLKRCSMA